ncbi:histidine phosphatase family protein [Floccifex sp.]|uniref:histidine phosphatase family protein n=1 Tax=Floccifex sp. TaxID=2815810 RepID=UPI003F0B3988
MRVYIVRHGQTIFNEKKRIQGWCDSPLTSLGIQQAKDTHEKLKDIDFEWAYSSTSERAMDTLDLIIGQRNIHKSHRKDLKEIHFGQFEGEREQYVFQELKLNREDLPQYGGESPIQAVTRVENALFEMSKKHDGNVLVVCHGGIMANLLRRHAPYMIDQLGVPMPNCTVLVFDVLDSISYVTNL